jgi:hypothetical protein
MNSKLVDSEKENNEIKAENLPGKNYLKGAIATLSILFLIKTGFDYSRPTIQGEITGGKFTNQDYSQVFVQNYKTGEKDTLYFDTTTDKLKILFPDPDFNNNSNKVAELQA